MSLGLVGLVSTMLRIASKIAGFPDPRVRLNLFNDLAG